VGSNGDPGGHGQAAVLVSRGARPKRIATKIHPRPPSSTNSLVALGGREVQLPRCNRCLHQAGGSQIGRHISPSAKAVGSRRSARGDAAVPQTPKTAAKKRPVPTRRSPVVKAGKAPAAARSGAEDDIKITALALAPGKLSPEMDAYFKKCE